MKPGAGLISKTKREGHTEVTTTKQPLFPAQYLSRTTDECGIQTAVSHLQGLKSLGIDSIYTLSAREVLVLCQKQSEHDLIAFEQWLSTQHNMCDPNTVKLVEDLYPEHFERRLDEINRRVGVQKQLAKIKMFGPQDCEDLFFLFTIHNMAADDKTAFWDYYKKPMFNTSRCSTTPHSKHSWLNINRFLGQSKYRKMDALGTQSFDTDGTDAAFRASATAAEDSGFSATAFPYGGVGFVTDAQP